MRTFLLIILFAISSSINAQICRVDWTNPTVVHSNETAIRYDIDHYMLYLRGTAEPTIPYIGRGSARHVWFTNNANCPPCQAIFMKAVYTDGTHSPLSNNACGINAPDLHGYSAINP